MSDSAAGDIARAEELIGQALAASPDNELAQLSKGLLLRAGPARRSRCRIRDGGRIQSQRGKRIIPARLAQANDRVVG
jgi:hypothetical protein